MPVGEEGAQQTELQDVEQSGSSQSRGIYNVTKVDLSVLMWNVMAINSDKNSGTWAG